MHLNSKSKFEAQRSNATNDHVPHGKLERGRAPAVDPDYVEEPTAADVELADVEEIADDEVPKLLDEADEIGAMRPRMRKSVTPAKKGAKEPAWPDEDEHADENFEHTDEFKRGGEADEDMEVDEGVTKKEIKNIVAECDEIGALRPRRIN